MVSHMGCICSNVSPTRETMECNNQEVDSKRRFSRTKSSRLDPILIWEKDTLNCGDVTLMLFDKANYGSMRSHVNGDHHKIERKKIEMMISMRSHINHPCLGRIPVRANEAEQVCAGWPAWLALVASEAIKGWTPRRPNSFEKLNKIGQGTYGSVYKARDVVNDKLVALKRVRFDNHNTESIKFMAREILILRKLDHPNVIKLEGLVTSQTSCTLYLIFEYMEHDLTGLSSRKDIDFTEPQVKCYMQQLLRGLDHCHSLGVLHRDIKGSNLLIDNNGILKIADFGLATFYDPNHRNVPLTSRVVTLWYRPPELLLGASFYGVAVDLWSTGCILGELYAGKPILAGKTEVEQLHKIFKLCGSPSEDYWTKLQLRHAMLVKPPKQYKRCLKEAFKDFPTSALGLIDILLSIDPTERGTTTSALKNEFFTTSPFPCDPSSLPTYHPSKEIDVKLWYEEAWRQGFDEKFSRRQNEYQDTQNRLMPKSRSEIFNHHDQEEDVDSCFLIDLPKQKQGHVKDANENSKKDSHSKKTSHLGLLIQGLKWGNSRKALELSNVSSHSSTSSKEAQATKFSRRHHMMRVGDGNLCTRDPTLGRGPKGDELYVSGSFLISSSNVNRMLKEHDHRIEQYARRSQFGKAEHGKS